MSRRSPDSTERPLDDLSAPDQQGSIAERRLLAQRLAGSPFDDATAVVRHLLAVQSQDYPGAKWALAQRLPPTTDAAIDAAFDAGRILRTHVLRPTWHFVDPSDLRWLLALTAPRVHAANAYQYRRLGIDRDVAVRSRAVIASALAGGRSMTRDELAGALEAAGVLGSRLRLGYLISDAELEGVVCSGPRHGKRQTYALLEERVPPSSPRERDESLAELARRYVTGHGPAQAADLAWWSGLTVAEARRALELAAPPLATEVVEGRTFWFHSACPSTIATPSRPTVNLLPNYDELLVAFRDRTDAFDPRLSADARIPQVILGHSVVRDGLVVGSWRRVEADGGVTVEITLRVSLSDAERMALESQARRLEAFLGRPVQLMGLD
jgi:hypothetical protein